MVTFVHTGGSKKQVQYLGVVALDGNADQTALIKWPLGEVFVVSLATGRIEPEPEQSPRCADWCADAEALARMQADAQSRCVRRPPRVRQRKAA